MEVMSGSGWRWGPIVGGGGVREWVEVGSGSGWRWGPGPTALRTKQRKEE